MNIGKNYIENFKKVYLDRIKNSEKLELVMKTVCSASKEDLDELLKKFPDVPSDLIEILNIIDGTYRRKYGEYKIGMYLFGSLEGLPHYLCSTIEMLLEVDRKWIKECIDWGIECGNFVDLKITKDYENLKWLNFSKCINNGGSSQFYIDFSPSDKGKYGQIVAYVHDPDKFIVIADSFSEFLQKIIDGKFRFIEDDIIKIYKIKKEN